MSSFSVLIDKIIKDAELKKQDILIKAREESEKIVLRKVEEANRYREDILKKAHLEGKEVKEKIISKCELEIRNSKLIAKRKVIDEVFDKALDELMNLDNERFELYVSYHVRNSGLIGEYNLIIPTVYIDIEHILRSRIDSENKREFKVLEIKPSDILKGGFILENKGIFINYSFEVLIDSIKDEIEFELSNLLFN